MTNPTDTNPHAVVTNVLPITHEGWTDVRHALMDGAKYLRQLALQEGVSDRRRSYYLHKASRYDELGIATRNTEGFVRDFDL